MAAEFAKEFTGEFKRNGLVFRPLDEFFDFGSLQFPKDANEISERLKGNLVYFQGNYFVVMLFPLTFVAYVYPDFLITNVFLILLGIFLFAYNKGDLKLGALVIQRAHLIAIYSVLYTLSFFYTSGWSSVYSMAIGILIDVIHAILRRRGVRESITTAVNEKLS
jgi:hypothetical protein